MKLKDHDEHEKPAQMEDITRPSAGGFQGITIDRNSQLARCYDVIWAARNASHGKGKRQWLLPRVSTVLWILTHAKELI